MRAFVAGATGLTGHEVVRRLAETGHEVVAHARAESRALDSLRQDCASWGVVVDTTDWEPEALKARLEQLAPQLVFGLIGTTRARAKAEGIVARSIYDQIDYGLTAMLIDAASALDQPPRFVYLSSVGTRPGVKNPYLAARDRTESHLRASGLPYTIARPSMIIGPRADRRPLERTAAVVADTVLAAGGLFGAKRFRDRFRSISGHDLAHALVAAAIDPDYENATLEGAHLQQLV